MGANTLDFRNKNIRLELLIFMTKKISCANVGHPECSFSTESDSEEELLKQVADHAAKEHDMKEISPDTLETIKKAIEET